MGDFIGGNGNCVVPDGSDKAELNKYAWNTKANMLYLEPISGIGYNPAKSKDDMKYNDVLVAEENLMALKDFFNKFHNFKHNDLYILGISYGGIQSPNLAMRIHQHNQISEITGEDKFNLKGMMVGNPATDWENDIYISYHKIAYYHNLINKELHDTYISNNCTWYFMNVKPDHNPPACQEYISKFINLTSRINWYDIYQKPIDISTPKSSTTKIQNTTYPYKRGYTLSDYFPFSPLPQNDIILGSGLSDYLNRADIRKALNIPDEIQPWLYCRRD
jgi:carboxypeptidase C (cathepsin A)